MWAETELDTKMDPTGTPNEKLESPDSQAGLGVCFRVGTAELGESRDLGDSVARR